MKLSECNFRDLISKFVLIRGEWVRKGAVKFLNDFQYSAPPNMDAALCYCYIDREAGLSFHFICLANFETGEIDRLHKDIMLIYRANPGFDVKEYLGDVSAFKNRKYLVERNYNSDLNIIATRDIQEVDHLRHAQYPDDIRVLLENDGSVTEYVWVRLSETRNGKLIGTLLNEPLHDFGVHRGGEVCIRLGVYAGEVYAAIELTHE